MKFFDLSLSGIGAFKIINSGGIVDSRNITCSIETWKDEPGNVCSNNPVEGPETTVYYNDPNNVNCQSTSGLIKRRFR